MQNRKDVFHCDFFIPMPGFPRLRFCIRKVHFSSWKFWKFLLVIVWCFFSKPGNIASKRKQKRSVSEKVDMIRKLEIGCSVKQLCAEYGIRLSTVYDIKEPKRKILYKILYKNWHPKRYAKEKKHLLKLGIKEKVLFKWFQLRQNEGVLLSGARLIAQCKVYHQKLNIFEICEYSQGWLH